MEHILQSKQSKREIVKLYLAGPLFSDAEKSFNQNLKKLLTPHFDVYLPQEDGGLLVDMIKKGMHPRLAVQKVFTGDIKAIKNCDMLLIILDGRTIDEGAAFELGFAYALGKPCYGLKTGPRQLLATGNNPMIDCPLECIFKSADELLSWANQLMQKSIVPGANQRFCITTENP